MAMNGNGLTKLMEECGELITICAKKLAYVDTDYHPDGTVSMADRMEEELADVMAASHFVMQKFNLDVDRVMERAQKKIQRYNEWDNEA